MHILILSKRDGLAQERMLAAAKAIGKAANIDSALIEALTPKSKDPAVRMMQQREAIADLLEALAVAAGIPLSEPAKEESAEEPAPESVTPVTEEPSQEAVSLPDANADSGEELPPPVAEDGEETRAVGGVVSGSDYLISEPDTREIFVPGTVEETTAEEPAADDKPKSAKKRTTKK